MIARSRVRYSELPSSARSSLSEDSFLRATQDADSGNLIVWTLREGMESQAELEFSAADGQLLSSADRVNGLPLPREFSDDEINVVVQVRHRLDPVSNLRYEAYRVHSRENGFVADFEQIYYAPVLLSSAEFVRAKWDQVTLPVQYSVWPEAEKVRHWVAMLYRARRSVGESGQDEDLAFSPALYAQMKSVDPAVDQLLPQVFIELSRMENDSAEALYSAFRSRVAVAP